MAHRGRLNVLTNIAGKTYGQIFREFEGTQDPRTVQGSGDVKYHLGTEGTFTALGGEQIPVYLAANPSHLEAVDGVLEGIVRAKQDRKPIGTFQVVPIMVHGDAAMAGQGIVVEVLQMSQLRGYRTGGTIHVVVNNQVGFTTPPEEARTSVYSTDVGKTIQSPIFHVNGDDPEAVVRVAELALEFRQRFHKDVIVDLICYRRRGHNEGDDPSMTQPLMYNLIEAKRSVRTLYGEALVGRGDITQDEYAAAQADFQDRLERAFAETHAAQTNSMPIPTQDSGAQHDLERPESQQDDRAGELESTGVAETVIATIGDAHGNKPAGFTVHPKLDALLKKRVEMSRNGSDRLGLRRAARPRFAAARGHPGAVRRPGCPPRYVRAAPRRAPRPRERPGVAAAAQPQRQPGEVLDLRLAPQRVRGDGLRVRLLGRAGRRPRALGGPVRRLRQRRPDRHRRVHLERRAEVGHSAPASCCSCRTATRAKDQTTRRPASSGSCRCVPRTT
jgi:2-oxoglutarate dehydrogenase complex dehydrogenase (E1) component-like enzyme